MDELNKLKSGLCSITFRQLDIPELVSLAGKAGLDAVEWGGDVHVPHGDLRAAETARQATLDEGLEVSSYGSYYRVLDGSGRAEDFQPVLDSALALGTDTIRIWAGPRGSAETDDTCRNRLVEAARQAAEQAAEQGVRLAFEFHADTLTDTNESAVSLMNALPCDNLYIYWQPECRGIDMAYRLAGLDAMLPRLLNFHVFHWIPDSTCESDHWIQRRPLGEGRADWQQYLQRRLPEGLPHFALLEFIRDDSPNQFLRDADTLKQWLAPPVLQGGDESSRRSAAVIC